MHARLSLLGLCLTLGPRDPRAWFAGLAAAAKAGPLVVRLESAPGQP